MRPYKRMLLAIVSASVALVRACPGQVSVHGTPPSFLFGKYYQGDGEGTNNTLYVRRDGTFIFNGHTDSGAQGHSSGSWSFTDGVLILNPQKANDAKQIPPVVTHLVPVHTRNRAFLVEVNAMPGFAFTMAKTDMSEMGLWSPTYKQVRLDRYDVLDVPGETPLPSKYMDFFKNGPVKAVVQAIQKDGLVRLNTKMPDRVKAGMLFTNIDWFSYVDLQITKIEPGDILARVLYRQGATAKVKVGDRFFTGEYYARPGEFDQPSFKDPPLP
jgi:hypothetical protein